MDKNHSSKSPHGGKSIVPNNKNSGAAMRAQRRARDDVYKLMRPYEVSAPSKQQRAHAVADQLKLTFLGGLEDVGEKNMAIIEYKDQAIVLDCGNSLGIDLPGVNYTINDSTYLESIRHKLKGYIITHGHLDHIGGLKHTVPRCPAPIYGSRYTIGLIEKAFDDLQNESGQAYAPELITAKLDTHEKIKVGYFSVEFIRVTHSLPDAAAVCIDTPVGRIVATGDFRLDPEPLDRRPTDTQRLKALGDQGVLILLSESSYADVEGRVPTESTLQQSFHDIIGAAPGRIFVAAFASNMNRTQMIINGAVAAGRHVALDGRGMLSYSEIAVRQGILKVPKGVIVPISQAGTIPAQQLLVMCTGGQGEPNAALQRMSQGEHKFVNLDAGDTVVISSSPIPGNEISYDQISNRLQKQGVHLYRHITHELDGCGPLHVSGHAKRDEMRDMIRLVRPKFLIPVHGGRLRRSYHAELGIEEGLPRQNVLLPENGDSLSFTAEAVTAAGQVAHGSVLIDQSNGIVDGIVVKDRLLLSEEGLLAVVLTIDRKSGKLLASPDVISRGFLAMRDNEELVNSFRHELQRAVQQRFKRVDVDRFKTELRDFMTQYMYEHVGRTPIVIPIINVIGGPVPRNTTDRETAVASEQAHFQAMRAKLLKSELVTVNGGFGSVDRSGGFGRGAPS